MSFISSLSGKSEFNAQIAEDVAKSFKTAMKGIGCDEKRIIKEILSLNNDQRQTVKHKYQTMYGHTLEEDLKHELKGHLEDIVIALLKPRYQFEAECIQSAIKGIGTNNKVVIEFLCSKDSNDINVLKKAYKTYVGKDLEEDIEGEGSGSLTRVYRSLASGKRPMDQNVDQELALKEAKEFHQAAEGKFFTNEGELVRILVSRSFAQLRATFEAYKKLHGKDIEKCIEKETRGDLEDALLSIVACIRNVPAYFAQRLLDAMKGLGSDKKQLIRILVSRSEVDLDKIKYEYKNLCKRSLYDDLAKELRGDFEEIVLNLVGKD